MPKKGWKNKMCVNYSYQNRESLKDDFPLPHIDAPTDNTVSCIVLLPRQFLRVELDSVGPRRSRVHFIHHWWRTFVIKSCQRAMTTLFHDRMHKELEVYVDDMIDKPII